MEIAQTADYALRVLLELEANDGQSMSELTTTIGLNRSVVHRTVGTLRRRSAVTRDSEGRYWLGPLIVALAHDLPHALAAVGRDALRAFAHRAEETVVVSVREGAESVVIAQERGHSGPLRVEYEVDFHQPLERGASSVAILAFADDDGARTLAAGRRELLEEVRARGFARTSGEIREDMVGLGVPIFTRHGVAGSLTLVAPATREGHVDSLLPDLRATATLIGREYGAYLDGHDRDGARR